MSHLYFLDLIDSQHWSRKRCRAYSTLITRWYQHGSRSNSMLYCFSTFIPATKKTLWNGAGSELLCLAVMRNCRHSGGLSRENIRENDLSRSLSKEATGVGSSYSTNGFPSPGDRLTFGRIFPSLNLPSDKTFHRHRQGRTQWLLCSCVPTRSCCFFIFRRESLYSFHTGEPQVMWNSTRTRGNKISQQYSFAQSSSIPLTSFDEAD